jgi:hypothetical protein
MEPRRAAPGEPHARLRNLGIGDDARRGKRNDREARDQGNDTERRAHDSSPFTIMTGRRAVSARAEANPKAITAANAFAATKL